ncbi:hypothetical protein BYT27DRAFT_7103732 [Phlegmacium glaucopus]|nr:hypothetical protein BYT27DRAFT_7103732 [Phlegmacium glaucopus]
MHRGRVGNNNRNSAPRNNNYQNRSTSNNNFNKPNIEKPKLSEKEMAELRASGKCFNCKEVGHMSRNCPDLQTVKGGGARPPGVPSYSMDMTLVEDIADTNDVLESMPVGAISVRTAPEARKKLPSHWRKIRPCWLKSETTARGRIGDGRIY